MPEVYESSLLYAAPLEAPRSFVDLLRRRAAEQPDDLAYVFLKEGEEEGERLAYGPLEARVRAVAARLQQVGASGERVLLLYPSGLDFVTAFLACLYAGAVAVPTYPPRSKRSLPRLEAIAADARPRVVLTTSALLPRITEWAAGVRCLATDAIDPDLTEAWAEAWTDPGAGPETLAFLQYTSGSTALPKGVEVSHGNLLYNEEMIRRAFGQSRESVIVSWLPLYHDMGLIGGVLQPAYLGARCILLSPVAFLQRPARWLEAISRYRATTSGGPNFAYNLCVRKVREAERAGLDLSTWDVAFNGAEPVRPETLDRFAAAFAPAGFRRRAFYPCYGLAEATLFVTGGDPAAEPVLTEVDGAALEKGRVSDPIGGPETGRRLVGCGRPAAGQQVVIVDPETGARCAADRVGEVRVAGPNVARGYWGRPETTQETFRARLADDPDAGPFLRTGDLGFLRGGELFVTGRRKDLIIVRGRNLYPQDLELSTEPSHPALVPGGGVAFALEVHGEERLVLVFEVQRHTEKDVEAICRAVRQRILEEHELHASEVVLIRAGSLPRTSSGKVRRSSTRAAYLAGELEVAGRSVESADLRFSAELRLGREELLALPAQRRSQALEDALRDWLAGAQGRDPGELDPAQPLSGFGLDSLMAVELMNGVEARMRVPLSLSRLLGGPSIVELAAEILSALDEPSSRSLPAVTAAFRSAVEHPLSYGQRSQWFLQRLAPESAAYNLVGAARIRGPLDLEALCASWAVLIDRHPSLRTVFPEGPVQRVQERVDVPFFLTDAAGWDEAALESRMAAEAYRPFALDQGPMLRIHVFRCAPEEHVLLLVVHHIVADFWSLAVLARELGSLYTAATSGGPAPALPALPLRYSDFVHWEAALLDGEEGERLWSYWRDCLAGEIPVLDLPTDRARPVVQTFEGSSWAFRIGEPVADAIKLLSRHQNATLYMAHLALFQELMRRYTGQIDFVVGSPTAGRNQAELAGLVGFFVNSLPLRAELSGNPSFRGLLGRVTRAVLQAFEHQAYPFARLVERLQPARDPGRSPLFQVMFALHGTSVLTRRELASFALGEAGSVLELGSLRLESLPWRRRIAQLDLTLSMAEAGTELAASMQYNTDLFDAVTIARMAGRFQALLCAAAAEPDRPLAELELFSPGERQQLWVEWNDSQDPGMAPGRFVHELFEEQARRWPEEPAVVFEERFLTYRELNRRANQLARHLRELDSGPEVCIGLFLERSLDLVVGILGVLKSGGAYVPLDPDMPRQKLALMLEEVAAPVVVTLAGLRDRLPPGSWRTVCLDEGAELLVRRAAGDLGARVGAAALAYVLFTSGSTGRPKGVAVEHRQLAAYVDAIEARLDLRPRDNYAIISTFSADLGNTVVFTSLTRGGCLHIVPQEAATDAEAVAACFRRRPVDILKIVPSHLEALLSRGFPEVLPRRWLVLGGEACRWELIDRIRELAPGLRILNHYGPTETTVGVLTFRPATAPEAARAGTVPIGRPLAGARAYLADGGLQAVPPGAVGEVLIGGDLVSRGYLGRPGLTAERFIPDPWSPRPGGRLYRSGDRARQLPSGVFQFLGRIDDQVKLHGYRLEPEEIRSVLNRHPQIRDSVVAVTRDAQGYDLLVAYYVSGQPIETAELREPPGLMGCRAGDSWRLRTFAPSAAHPQRQDRPPGASYPGRDSAAGLTLLRRSAHPYRRVGSGDLGRGVGCASRRRR